LTDTDITKQCVQTTYLNLTQWNQTVQHTKHLHKARALVLSNFTTLSQRKDLFYSFQCMPTRKVNMPNLENLYVPCSNGTGGTCALTFWA